MSMTNAEKIAAWGVETWYEVSISRGDEWLGYCFFKELPKWGNIISNHVAGINCNSSFSGSGLTGTRFGTFEAYIYNPSTYVGADIEDNSSAFLTYETLTVEGDTYYTFAEEVTVRVTPYYLFAAQLVRFGNRVSFTYKDRVYGGYRTSVNTTSIVLGTDDLDGTDAFLVKVGEDVDISEDNPIEWLVSNPIGRPSITVQGLEEVYYDASGKMQRGNVLCWQQNIFPFYGISLRVLQNAIYQTVGQQQQVKPAPLMLTPYVGSASRWCVEMDGDRLPAPLTEEGWDYLSEGEVLEAPVEDDDRFLGWSIDRAEPLLTIPRFTIPSGVDFSILQPVYWRRESALLASLSAPDFPDVEPKIRTEKGEFTATDIRDGERVTLFLEGSFDPEIWQFLGWRLDDAITSADDGILVGVNPTSDVVWDWSLEAGEYNYVWAVFRKIVKHVKLDVQNPTWGEADIIDIEGNSVLDENGEADLIWGRTYRFRATVKDYGNFNGWYVAGPNYQSDDTDITAIGENYTNAEYTYLTPTDGTNMTLVAKFAEPTIYIVGLDTDNEPDVVAENIMSVVEGRRPSNPQEGEYYHGPITVRADAAVGWRLKAWKLNNVQVIEEGDEGFEETYTFILSDETTTYNETTGMREVLVEGVFETDSFNLDAALDAASDNKGSIIIRKSEDYGETYTATTATNFISGTYLRVSVKANTGSAFRKITDGGAEVVVQTISDEEDDDNGRTVYDFRLFRDTTIRAFFGATVTVEAKNKSGAETNGRVAASLSKTGPWDSLTCDFTYGETVWIKAINSEVDGNTAYFNSWHHSSDVTGTTTLTFANPLPKYGPLIGVVETGNVTYVCKFSATKQKVGIRITNSGNDRTYGDIRILTGGGDTSIVEVNVSTYEGVIKHFFDETSELPSITPYHPAGVGIDRYYVVNQGDAVRLVCDVINPEQYPFDTFKRRHYTAFTSMSSNTLTPTAEVIDTEENANFIVYANVIVYTFYQTSVPHDVVLRYATGSNRTMGTLDITPAGVNGIARQPRTVNAAYRNGAKVTASVTIENGYKFAGWYSDQSHTTLISRLVNYTFTMGSTAVELFAAFAPSENGVWEWEGSTDNKTMVWRSRRYVLAQPTNLTSAAVYADDYPMELKAAYASSPDPEKDGWTDRAIEVKDQDPRRLPLARPEKYIELEVTSAHPVTRVAAGTSMQGLLNG